jgi:hypothetical protein
VLGYATVLLQLACRNAEVTANRTLGCLCPCVLVGDLRFHPTAMKALDLINGKYSPDFIQFLYLMMTCVCCLPCDLLGAVADGRMFRVCYPQVARDHLRRDAHVATTHCKRVRACTGPRGCDGQYLRAGKRERQACKAVDQARVCQRAPRCEMPRPLCRWFSLLFYR